MMDQNLRNHLAEELGKQRSAILQRRSANEASSEQLESNREIELQERAQEERIVAVLDNLEDRDQERLREIDSALERLAAGDLTCENCGRSIEEERLRVNPTLRFCAECASRLENPKTSETPDETPDSAPLPPDLDILDEDELRDRLFELIREDGQVDTDELQISTRNGVVFLEGAVPSETEHEMLLNILTDVAGVREIKDNPEVQRLAWEREDRSKEEAAGDVQPGTIPNDEPYGGTEDPVLADEEGVDYEPPVNQPPPIRKG
jgi:RNA polymerase-binding transcription factor DksA